MHSGHWLCATIPSSRRLPIAFRSMSNSSRYLYDNALPDAEIRLHGLEAIEDDNSIFLLKSLGDIDGSTCLEIGAGAGSIALWLASQVGPSGSVMATDIEPKHLSGCGYEVLRHDIAEDGLPIEHYDLVHIRHVLIHLTDPARAIQKTVSSMKFGGVLLAEESNLTTWRPEGSTPENLQEMFQNGVDAILSTYESRGMSIRFGTQLAALLNDAGLAVTDQKQFKRRVLGGSPEAIYQSKSANQLADTIDGDSSCSESIKKFADCLLSPELRYQSRTTVSVTAKRIS